MTTSLLAPNAPLPARRTVTLLPPDQTIPVRLFRADACGNSFLIVLGEAAEVEEAAARIVRQADRWTFDSVLAVGRLLDQLGLDRRVLLRDGTELAIGRTADGLYSVPMGPVTSSGDFLPRHRGDWPRFRLYRACGEPHAVVFVPSVQEVDLDAWGWATVPQANCTVVSRRPDGQVFARTFERGVNRETRSCGTGATSAAQLLLDMDAKPQARSASDGTSECGEEVVHVRMKGGTLRIRVVPGRGSYLEGPAWVWQAP